MNALEKYEKYLYLIFLIGTIIYIPIFFNGFVWDDMPFILDNVQIHHFDLLSLFGKNDFNAGPFYRPLPAVYFAIIYSLAGNTAFLYHLIQIILHNIGTFLLFVYFCSFIDEYLAFFLALIFLVHPINVESVAYIGSTQSELYFIPGISALILAQKKYLSKQKFYFILFFLIISIFTKEVGFLFLFLTILYRFIFKLGDIKRFLISGSFIVITYLLIRIFYAGVIYKMSIQIPIAELPLTQRLLNIPSILIYYFKTFLFPTKLMIWQLWVVKSVSWDSFFFPLLLCLLTAGFMLLAGFFLFQKQQKDKKYDKPYFSLYLFFFIWFALGLGMLLQLVPLDMTVADRWFYFPIVGLLGIIGISSTACFPTVKTHNKQYIIIAIILLLLLASRTFIRTFDYKDNYTLYGHDIREGDNNAGMIEDYALVLWNDNRYTESCDMSNRSAAIAKNAYNMNEVGNCDQINQQYDQAITAYERALQLYPLSHGLYLSLKPIYYNLAHVLILANRPQEAINFINNQALPKYPRDKVLTQFLNGAESEAQQASSVDLNDGSTTQSSQGKTNIVNPQLLQQMSAPTIL